jgi:HSP90 family molecular chaperone
MEFRAETKRLLEIVAHSLYTDKDVFIRELLSNASDALEKQRFMQESGRDVKPGDSLQIMINLDSDKKEITIFDTVKIY